MIVILNPKAGAGTALDKWKKIESKVRELVGPYTLIAAGGPDAVRDHVARAMSEGEREFIAAGGDGTVNLVMTSILASAPRGAMETIKLGAIGLGSSNDFHKPITAERQIDGVPFKLDFLSTAAHDIGMLTYRNEEGELRSRRWLINASVGTTAEANRFFNNPNGLLRTLKKLVPSVGMVYAALRTVINYHSRIMTVTLDEKDSVHVPVKNLGIVKNPHFTGSLSYDSPYEPASGHFYVHLLERVWFPRLALTLLGLLYGKFSGSRGTHSWRATRLRIEADRPFAVEGDGEVVTVSRAYFSVVPGLLQVCT
jgi:diacylglycerol kinase family enzyme